MANLQALYGIRMQYGIQMNLYNSNPRMVLEDIFDGMHFNSSFLAFALGC